MEQIYFIFRNKFSINNIMKNCSNCPYSFCGHRDSESDICDGCTHDPDTGMEEIFDKKLEESNVEYKHSSWEE